MRVIAYIDGFNLYYRALKPNPHLKWLNLEEFARRFLRPGDALVRVNYYTAPVSGLQDPAAPQRQQAYLRALKTLPCVEIHHGSFMRKEICRPLVHPIPLVRPLSPDGQFVLVKSTEEKGSDVNLAAHLLRDAFTNATDVGLVVSADTDLIEPIRIVTSELGKPVGLVNPSLGRPAPPKLASVCSFLRHVDAADLKSSQFPDRLLSRSGRPIARPVSWA
jgi:uncharacterized LabA/DUF88 family protein